MMMTLTTFQRVVRVAGVLALMLGLLFWTGDAQSLVPVHMLLGVLRCCRCGCWRRRLAAGRADRDGHGAVVVGLLVLGLGFTQASLLPGSGHWVIQVVHLVLGMAAVGSGEMIGGRVRRRRQRRPPRSSRT